jgi:hypothetical protein
MVKKLKVIEVSLGGEETKASEPEEQVQSSEPEMINKIEPDDAEDNEAITNTEVEQQPTPKPQEKEESKEEIKTKTIDQVSCKDCGKLMSAKNLRYAHKKFCTAREQQPTTATATPPPPTPNKSPEKTEIPTEEIKTAAKPKTKAKAKPKVKIQDHPDTHEPDEVPPRGPPPPSREKKQKPETPDEFWRNTLQNMKEKKDRQYASLTAAAF